jgi:hypothetical protein
MEVEASTLHMWEGAVTNISQSNRYRWLKLSQRGREIAMRLCQDTLGKSSIGREVARGLDLREGSLFVTLPLSYDEAAFIRHPIHASILDGDLDHQAIDELVGLIMSWRLQKQRDVLTQTRYLLKHLSSIPDYLPYFLVYEGDVFARATACETDAQNTMEFIWRFERLTPYNVFFFDGPIVCNDLSREFDVPILTTAQVQDVVKSTQMISTMLFDGAGYILWTRPQVETPKECC